LSKNHERRQQNWRLAGSVHSIKLLACKSKVGAIALLRYVRWVSPFVTTTPVVIA
jgi:hypothetical protein